MKKKIIILMCFCSLLYITSVQVGINTSNPQATFHIDGQKNNPSTGVPNIAQQSDDIVGTSTGNLGARNYCSYC